MNTKHFLTANWQNYKIFKTISSHLSCIFVHSSPIQNDNFYLNDHRVQLVIYSVYTYGSIYLYSVLYNNTTYLFLSEDETLLIQTNGEKGPSAPLEKANRGEQLLKTILTCFQWKHPGNWNARKAWGAETWWWENRRRKLSSVWWMLKLLS